MSWGRFKFYCNEVLRLLEKGEDVISAFETTKASVLSKEFGEAFKPREIQSSILESLKGDDFTKEEVKQALEIYNNLDLSALIIKPSRIRRVGIYIGYLTITYIVLSGIYVVQVIPNMSSMLEVMEIPAAENYTWFAGNWATIVIVVLCILITALMVSEVIKKMFDYKTGMEESVLYRFLIPGGLKARYEKLASLLRLPLCIVRNRGDDVNDEIIHYYLNEKYQTKELSNSLSNLIGENLNHLIVMSESYMRRIYLVVAILIIFSILTFVTSAYAPLFAMGDIL
jgi:hypothetical protein